MPRRVHGDGLTGLHNRRTFDSWLHQRSPAGQHPTALMLVDIDGFKQVNDIHGHDRGDAVLRRFGQLLLACVRPGDLAVRHGGDEFAVLIEAAKLTLPAARERARDLLAAIAAEPWADLAPRLTVTASIGMAFAVPTAGHADYNVADPTGLYRAADAALYSAKGDGSGLVISPGPVLPPSDPGRDSEWPP